MENVSQKVLDILVKHYGVILSDIVEIIPYTEISDRGYGIPSKKGVHAMHFPEHMGFYYIIKCRKDTCPICFA